MTSQTLQWSAYEAGASQKSADWYWALGIIAASGAASAILFSNALFAIVIVLGALALGLHAARPAGRSSVELNEKGVLVNETFYPYRELLSFWVEDGYEAPPKLFIKGARVLSPQIILQIEDVEPEEVRDFLLEYLEEEEMHEPLSQKVLEFFGF